MVDWEANIFSIHRSLLFHHFTWGPDILLETGFSLAHVVLKKYIYSVGHIHHNMGNCKILEEVSWQATNMRNLCGKLSPFSFLMMLNIFKVNYNGLNCIKYDIISKPHENESI